MFVAILVLCLRSYSSFLYFLLVSFSNQKQEKMKLGIYVHRSSHSRQVGSVKRLMRPEGAHRRARQDSNSESREEDTPLSPALDCKIGTFSHAPVQTSCWPILATLATCGDKWTAPRRSCREKQTPMARGRFTQSSQ